jgi:hypothetical protein
MIKSLKKLLIKKLAKEKNMRLKSIRKKINEDEI